MTMFSSNFTNLPYVRRARVLRDSGRMIAHPVAVFEQYRREYGQSFAFRFGGVKRAIVTTDPNLVQHVLHKNYENYHKSDIQVERMAEFQGQGLLNSHGEAWLTQRKHISKGFRPGFLAQCLPLQEEVLAHLMARFDALAAKGPVAVYPEMVRFTLLLVGKTLFGHQITDNELHRIGTAIAQIQAFILKQIIRPFMIPWFRVSGQSARFQDLRVQTDQIVRDIIAARIKSGEQRIDLLQVMLDTPIGETGAPMKPEQILIESLQLLVAGNETSSVALTWCLYLLAKHPAYIEAARAEINEVCPVGHITAAGLRKMPLLARILDEAMRLYPSFWMVDRVALADDSFGGVKIPAGTLVLSYIYGIHRNPLHWPDPDVFDPSRFEKANEAGRHPFAHIPFGGGPRVCVGANLALMQMFLTLATIIRKYDFSLVHPHVDIDPMMILRPKGGMLMNFTPVRQESP